MQEWVVLEVCVNGRDINIVKMIYLGTLRCQNSLATYPED